MTATLDDFTAAERRVVGDDVARRFAVDAARAYDLDPDVLVAFAKWFVVDPGVDVGDFPLAAALADYLVAGVLIGVDLERERAGRVA